MTRNQFRAAILFAVLSVCTFELARPKSAISAEPAVAALR
jgi:hypothetical protein